MTALAADDRADPVAVALGVAQALEYQDTAALTADIAVGGGVEGLAPAVRRQHPGTGGRDDRRRAQQDVDTAGQRHIAIARVQRLAGLMDGHQRRAARGVHRHRRPFQPEGEGDPAGDGIERVAGDEVGFEVFHRVARQQMRVLVGAHADEDTGSAAAQRRRGVPGPFQALPGDFEHQALLRIDPHGLARGDAEELRIEAIDAFEVSAAAGVDLARRLLIGS